jgi:chromosome segregation ATPase
MNNLKMNLYSVLTTVGLKDTAKGVLVNEFKNNLPALSELDTAVNKLQAVSKTYKTLEDSLQGEIQQLRADIDELEQSIFEIDVTKPKAIDDIMKVNAQIAMKHDRISAIMSALNALTAKGKAEKLDALADGYTAIKKVSAECTELVQTTKPVLNALNMSAIKEALMIIDAENADNFSEIVLAAQQIGVEQDRHNGQLLYHPYNTTFMSYKIAE